MAKQNFKLDPDTKTVDIDKFNNHKHTIDMKISYTEHDKPGEIKQTSSPILI